MPARLIYSDSEKSADMYYASGLFAPDPFLFLQEASGTRHIVTSALEIDRARRVSRAEQVHDWQAVERRFRSRYPDREPKLAVLTAFLLKEMAIEQVEVPDTFPLGLASRLSREGIRVEPREGAFHPERAIKTPDEVALLEAALRVTEKGMQTAVDVLRDATIGADGGLHWAGEPLTSGRLRGEIHATLVRHGAMPWHTIVAGGRQGADPHEEGHGPLRANESIIVDIFPRMEATGYWGDMTRTLCKGPAPAVVQQAWDAVLQAQELAIGLVRDGASGKAIHARVTESLTGSGFPTGTTPDGRQQGFFHGTGHGVGLEIHEAPRISTRDEILQAGQVVTVEPGVYYPDWGGVRLEDVVCVEPGGCRNLSRFPKFLEV